MNKYEELQKQAIKFRDSRDWKQFHAPKDMAMSIAIEAAELMECFQWKNKEEIEKYLHSGKSVGVNEEMADILIYLVTMAHDLDIDLIQEALNKLEKNDKKYPVEKAKGNATKYTDL